MISDTQKNGQKKKMDPQMDTYVAKGYAYYVTYYSNTISPGALHFAKEGDYLEPKRRKTSHCQNTANNKFGEFMSPAFEKTKKNKKKRKKERKGDCILPFSIFQGQI